MTLILKLFYDLPKTAFSQILSSFLLLPDVSHISGEFVIVRDGCVNVCVCYHKNKRKTRT